jgi:hypothetical protein
MDFVAARREVQQVADDLEALQLRMRGILDTLPKPVEERPLKDLDEMDPETEVRSVIGCVLADCIGPAIRDLRGMLIETEGAGDPKP